MHRPLALLLACHVVACSPKPGGAETEDATNTGSTTGPAATSTGDGSTVATSTSTGETTDEPTGGTTVGPWTVDACLTHFEWDCDPNGGCAPPTPVPFHACTAETLCDPVEIKTQGTNGSLEYEVVVPEAAGLCVLQALRDRTPGQVQIIWGDPQGFAGDSGLSVSATVTILAEGVVLMDWDWGFSGCCVERASVSRRAVLQPAAYFDDCLAMPTTPALIECFVAGAAVLDPSPDGWMPPWTTGMCDDIAPSCPG